MPGGKFTKKDSLKEAYRQPSKIELLSKIAEEAPYGSGIAGYPKRSQEEPGGTEPFIDPIPTPPIGKAAKLAISLPFATKQIKDLLKGGIKFTPARLREVADALRILRATPKRALQTISDLDVGGPEMAALYTKVPHLLGQWSGEHAITIRPWNLGHLGGVTLKGGQSYTLPEALAHETGHELTERLLQRGGKTLVGPFGEYDLEKGLWEGIAEYLGKQLAEKAKVPFTPKFGHGTYGELPKLIYGALSRYPSKNPYMNVYRFLQKEGTLLPKRETQKLFTREGRKEADRAVAEFQQMLSQIGEK